MDSSKKLNVFLRGMRLSGGAPRSLHQYMKVLKNDGCTVTVAVQEHEESLKELYEKEVDRLLSVRNIECLWKNRDFTAMYRQLISDYRYLKEEKPDVAFLLGYINGYFHGRMCNKLSIPSVMVIPGGNFNGGR